MALLTFTPIYVDGSAEKFGVYKVAGVTTGDTVDLTGQFQRITGAAFLSMSGGTLFTTLAAAVGLVVTLSNTGMVKDTGFLLVVGSAA
jgi:hypothetical protein